MPFQTTPLGLSLGVVQIRGSTSDEEFVLLGEEIPLKPQSPVRLLELTLTAEEVLMLEETIRRLSVNSRIKAPGRRFKVGLLLAPLD